MAAAHAVEGLTGGVPLAKESVPVTFSPGRAAYVVATTLQSATASRPPISACGCPVWVGWVSSAQWIAVTGRVPAVLAQCRCRLRQQYLV